MKLRASQRAFEEAKQYIPGGVNSPVRSFRSVGGTPPFIERAEGSHIYDIDGNDYVDYVLSWGPMLLGHSHPQVVDSLQKAIHKGTSFGAPTVLETEVAKKIQSFIPSIEMVRMVNSGTEATMSALRLARGYTGRSKIVKCIGCYHGHSDGLLVKAGSGLATFGEPDSPGVTENTAKDTLTVPFNDLQAMEALFEQEGEQIAAIIIEPVAGNMGCIPPLPGYLEGLRQLTKKVGALLIFDEVMCGFRAFYRGAQGLYQVEPDLTCLGKVVGGGLPMAAFGGKREIMSALAPAGPVYQAGTLSGNPLAMAAGLATLSYLEEHYEVFEMAEEKARKICQAFDYMAKDIGIPLVAQRVGSMFTFFFTDKPVHNFEDACQTNEEAFRTFFHKNLELGVYYAPSRFESNFMSYVHGAAELKQTIKAGRIALEAAAAIMKS